MPRDGRLPEPLAHGRRRRRRSRSSPTGRRSSRATRCWAIRARRRPTRTRRATSTCAPGPSRRSTSTAIEGGSPQLQKTVLPVMAEANVSIRLAPGQDPEVVRPEVERLLREAAPAGADVEIERWSDARPGLISPEVAGRPARAGRLRAGLRHAARCSSAPAARCRSSRRSRTRASRRSSPASRSSRATCTRRTSVCSSSTYRWASHAARACYRAFAGFALGPGRRVVHPAPADHRRDDLTSASSSAGRHRVAVEHDEVGQVAGEQLAAAALVAGEPGRGDARRVRAPARRSRPAPGATPGARRASAARLRACPASGSSSSIGASEPFATTAPESTQRAPRVRAVEPPGPEALGQIAVGRRVAELHGRGDAELRRSGRRPPAPGTARARCACRRPRGAHSSRVCLERVERVAVRAVADRVHGDRPAGPRRAAHDLGELLARS